MKCIVCNAYTTKQIKQTYLKKRINCVKHNLSACKKIAIHACGEEQPQNVSIECHILWNEVNDTENQLEKLYDELNKTYESWDVI
jgi:hypothetical protein